MNTKKNNPCLCPLSKDFSGYHHMFCPVRSKVDSENILARNPYTGNFIDLKPFFDFVHNEFNDDVSDFLKHREKAFDPLIEIGIKDNVSGQIAATLEMQKRINDMLKNLLSRSINPEVPEGFKHL